MLSGPLSDFSRNRAISRGGRKDSPPPEQRLWFSYPAFALSIAGFVIFAVTLDRSAAGVWNIRPNVGLAICAAGNQMLTTALFTCEFVSFHLSSQRKQRSPQLTIFRQTDAVDCNLRHASGVGVAIILVRQIWSFVSISNFTCMCHSLSSYSFPADTRKFCIDWSVLVYENVRIHRSTWWGRTLLCYHARLCCRPHSFTAVPCRAAVTPSS